MNLNDIYATQNPREGMNLFLGFILLFIENAITDI